MSADVALGNAPGKVILFGEHAVVYGRPAIAVPVTQVQATAEVTAGATGFEIRAVDLGRAYQLTDAPADDPLAAAVRVTLKYLGANPPFVALTVRSTIPIASGMGSGAAVSVAIIRALGNYLGVGTTEGVGLRTSEQNKPLSDSFGRPYLEDQVVSDLAFEVEKIHHGTPSGIDNSVVAFCRPVYFVRGQPVQTFPIQTPFQLLIADTGVPSPTKATVRAVRAGWLARPGRYEALFDQIGRVAKAARAAIENGRVDELGPLMRENQALLERLEVSSPQLEAFIQAALVAGADGAKLSGGGRGGNLIVLVRPGVEGAVGRALRRAGAVSVLSTWVAGIRGMGDGEWGMGNG